MKRFSGAFSRQVGALFFRPSTVTPLFLQQQQQQRFLSTTSTSGGNAVPGVGGDVQDTEETHPDFQPRLVNTEFAEDEVAMVKKDIDDTIKTEDVVAFIKGVPEAPMCAFSKRMIDVLEVLGLEYTSFDVLAHPVVRTYVKEVSEWPTIPQLFMKGEFVGGLDVVQKMLESGDLQKLLQQKGISFRNP
ncbi:Glutaredoxin [Trypanosoma melophagium]|uniref:Glutaredoxin n=1 Tax=Trypanosoma melophagium TaxID=715481 RepID=UPI00351A7A4F|nr:Glutaredoxin [Trypanosoma melophagium]